MKIIFETQALAKLRAALLNDLFPDNAVPGKDTVSDIDEDRFLERVIPDVIIVEGVEVPVAVHVTNLVKELLILGLEGASELEGMTQPILDALQEFVKECHFIALAFLDADILRMITVEPCITEATLVEPNAVEITIDEVAMEHLSTIVSEATPSGSDHL